MSTTETPAPAAASTTPEAAPVAAAAPTAATPGETSLLAKPADATTPAETKPAEKPADAAPDFELKFAEGVTVDEAQVKAFKATAHELGLDAAKAQKLVDLYSGMTAARAKADTTAWEAEQAKAVAAVKADPELGGKNLEASVKLAQRGADAFGNGKKLIAALDRAGLGNDVEVVRFLAAVGRSKADDTIAGTAGAAGAEKPSEDSLLRAAYPTMFKQN